jgi:hypothetical protein
MAEILHMGDSAGYKISPMKRLRTLLRIRRWPGFALAALGIGWRLLDVGGRLDMLSRVVEGMGGNPAMIAPIISSVWFSVGLVVLGVAYVVFLGEPKKGVQRHPAWPYVAWIVVIICLTLMIAIPGYGAIELYIRREIAKGETGVPRNTPDPPSRPQPPAYSAERSLQPDQVRILSREFAKLKDVMPRIAIAVPPRDNEPYRLRMQFDNILLRVGIVVDWVERVPHGLDDVDFMLLVKDTNDIPAAAERFREALAVANINLTLASPVDTSNPSEWAFFIAPRPLN